MALRLEAELISDTMSAITKQQLSLKSEERTQQC